MKHFKVNIVNLHSFYNGSWYVFALTYASGFSIFFLCLQIHFQTMLKWKISLEHFGSASHSRAHCQPNNRHRLFKFQPVNFPRGEAIWDCSLYIARETQIYLIEFKKFHKFRSASWCGKYFLDADDPGVDTEWIPERWAPRKKLTKQLNNLEK